jgi:hypothetical protein
MSKATVVDLASFRNKKIAHESFSGNRKPLGATHKAEEGSGTLPERLQKIKSSLDRINRLMQDLKSLEKK